ncbi:MAG: ATP-dependent Clp protease ATP-binding subunit [Micavibrio aeruginosavorus]|uniref:ATP-dependent Clp protease ATP-binding subunit n=1 Tax=Micavibrio aeruginosavorus TaxID=349221 RepID=A0A2W5PQU8_9BACT|nr:MAG: ATP-dependent Clp protease ATP-binding subunit [Micavibrio aeruginosavorus]
MAEKKKYNFKVPQDELEDLLHQYCRNYTALAKEGRFDPIIGRDVEIDNVMLILLQRNRKNACLLAPAGVGKTALVVGLAQAVVAERVPEYLKGAQVLELDMPAMAAGTDSPAEFQARFIPICRGIAERYHHPEFPRYVLFIDEIHTIMPTVTGSAYAGLSEVMKPYLTVGDLHVIGATTIDEFREYVAVDPALDRRFQKVHLKMPNAEETVQILKGVRPNYERHHKLTIPDECIAEVVKLTDEHMRKRTQPDKSIITMDAACAWHNMFRGDVRVLSMEAIHMMVAKETGLNPNALSDTRYDRKETFDPTKMTVQTGAKDFSDTQGKQRYTGEKSSEEAAE